MKVESRWRKAGFVGPDDDSEGVGGSRSGFPLCSTARKVMAQTIPMDTVR
jgi:hypothetical protein